MRTYLAITAASGVLLVAMTAMVRSDRACPYKVIIGQQRDTAARASPTNRYGSPCSQANINDGQCWGGWPRRVSLIKSWWNETRVAANTSMLLVDGGFLLTFDRTYSFFRGEIQSHFMKTMNFSAVAAQSTDFMHGVHALTNFQTITPSVKVLGTNLAYLGSRELVFQPYVIEDLPNGIRVGVFSIQTENIEVKSIIFSSAYHVLDEFSYAGAAVGRLQELGVDLIVAFVSTQDHRTLEIMRAYLDRLIAPIHVILGDHQMISDDGTQEMYNGMILATCGRSCTNGHMMTRLDLCLDENKQLVSKSEQRTMLDDSIASDPEAESYLEQKLALMAASDNLPQGSIDFNTDSFDPVTPAGTVTGAIVADSMLTSTSALNTDCAISNSGGIRDVFYSGSITTSNIYSISVFSLRGGYLLQALQLATRLQISYAFPQVSGIRFSWNPLLADGVDSGRITSVEVRNKDTGEYEPLQTNTIYRVAVNSFMRVGGDGYSTFPEYGFDFHDDYIGIQDALIQHVNRAPLTASMFAEKRVTESAEDATRLMSDCDPGQFIDEDFQCRDCARGQYSNSKQATSCGVCLSTEYAEHTGMTSCESCPEHSKTFIAGATNLSMCQCSQGFYGENGGSCKACPYGAECLGGSAEATPLLGYFRSPDDEYVFYDCLPPEACAGNPRATSTCSKGYTGPLCGTCEPNYYRSSSETCNECSPGDAILFSVLVVCICAGFPLAVAFVVRQARQPYTGGGFLVAWDGIQTLALFPLFAEFPRPGDAIFKAFGLIGLNIGVLSPVCAISMDTETWWLIRSLAGLAFIGLGVVMYAVAVKWKKMTSSELIECTCVMTTLLHPMWTKQVFEIFDCHLQISDDSYVMTMNPSHNCYSGRWNTFFLPVALLVEIPFLVIVPVAIFVLTKNKRQRVQPLGPGGKRGSLQKPFPSNDKALFLFYTRAYEPLLWHWSFVNMVKTFLLVHIMAFTTPRSNLRIFFGVFILMLHFVLKVLVKPFTHKLDNILDISISMVVLLNLVMAFGFRDVSSQPHPAFLAVNYALMVMSLLLILAAIAVKVYESRMLSVFRKNVKSGSSGKSALSISPHRMKSSSFGSQKKSTEFNISSLSILPQNRTVFNR